MYKMTDVLYAVLTAFQGYCLQYFLGNFLEGRMKRRWNGLYAAALYVILRMAVLWGLTPGYEDYKAAIGTLAVSLFILSFIALSFYKALRPVTVFLIVSFQAVSDISSYAAVILLDKAGAGVLNAVNWCAGRGAFTSEDAYVMAIKVSTAGMLLFQYMAIALLLYFSLKRIVWNFHEKDYSISRTELLFILTPAAVGLMICMLLRIIMFTVEDSVPEMLYGRYPVLTIVLPVILLLSLLSILYGVKMFQEIGRASCRERVCQ